MTKACPFGKHRFENIWTDKRYLSKSEACPFPLQGEAHPVSVTGLSSYVIFKDNGKRKNKNHHKNKVLTLLKGKILGSDPDLFRAVASSLGFEIELFLENHWLDFKNGSFTGVIGNIYQQRAKHRLHRSHHHIKGHKAAK